MYSENVRSGGHGTIWPLYPGSNGCAPDRRASGQAIPFGGFPVDARFPGDCPTDLRQITSSQGKNGTCRGSLPGWLVTELRLVGAATITEAEKVLNGLLLQFNGKVGVRAERDCPAHRYLEQSASLDRIFCFKHRWRVSRDNTVKYSRRTLQLLPDGTRPTFAGMQVEVQEGLDSRLMVQYQGQTIPTQEAPPRPTWLEETAAAPPENPGMARGINGAGSQCDSHLGTLETGDVARDSRPRRSRAQQHRIPTARQSTLWENVQQAKYRSLSLRAVTRELRIHGNTLKLTELVRPSDLHRPPPAGHP